MKTFLCSRYELGVHGDASVFCVATAVVFAFCPSMACSSGSARGCGAVYGRLRPFVLSLLLGGASVKSPCFFRLPPTDLQALTFIQPVRRASEVLACYTGVRFFSVLNRRVSIFFPNNGSLHRFLSSKRSPSVNRLDFRIDPHFSAWPIKVIFQVRTEIFLSFFSIGWSSTPVTMVLGWRRSLDFPFFFRDECNWNS